MPVLTKSRWEAFASGIATGLKPTDAYISAGYESKSPKATEVSARRLLRNASIANRITEVSSEIATIRKREFVRLVSREISERQNRIDALQDRWERLRAVITARAADPELRKVPGGETGLLTITKYKAETYFGTDPKTGEQVRMTRLVPEYAVDTGLLHETRAHEEQAARECGQWVERQDINLKAQVESVSVTLAQALTPAELRELREKVAAASSPKQIEASAATAEAGAIVDVKPSSSAPDGAATADEPSKSET